MRIVVQRMIKILMKIIKSMDSHVMMTKKWIEMMNDLDTALIFIYLFLLTYTISIKLIFSYQCFAQFIISKL